MLRTLAVLSAVLTVLLAGGLGLFRDEARPVVAGPPPAPQCAPVAPGLLSWWRANPVYVPELIAKDYGPANVNGILAGDATIDDGYIGPTFGFAGVDGRIILGHPSALRLTTALTIEGWVNVTSLAQNSYAGILTKWSDDASLGTNGNAYWFGLQGTSTGPQLFISVHQNVVSADSQPFTAGGLFSAGQWTHVAMTYNATTGALFGYVNGVLSASYVAPGRPLHSSDADMLIGGQAFGAPRLFNGKIDELSVYGKVLSPAQIAAIATAGASGKCLLTVNSTGNASDADAGDGICRTATAGECTLRAAIEESNALAGADYIPFGIDGCATTCLIATPPFSADLPTLGQATIDGYTQPGANPNSAPFGSTLNWTLKIQIQGANDGLRLVGSTTVRGVIISGFFSGFDVTSGDQNTISGNYIKNSLSGIITRSSNNTIGGPTAADRNLISGNTHGINLTGLNSKIQGNYIGVSADPAVASPNDVGIWLTSANGLGTKNNIVGGTGAGEANLIAYNTSDFTPYGGVVVDDGGFGRAFGNQIRGNSIHSNALGIDLQNGGNLALAAPVVKSAGSLGAGGTGCANCTIDVFSDAGSQGATYQGTTTAAADGKWYLIASINGPNVTATNTDAGNNTSEFSAPLAKSNDSDGDGYTDIAELTLTENPVSYCAIMRANVDNSADNTVSILDLATVAQQFGQNIPPANPRFNQLQGSDVSINILDLAAMAGQFLQNVSACP